MNAFNAPFAEFCAGNGDLDQVVAALESDLRRDRQSCERNLSLIELAWRTGKIDPDSYTTLKEILDQPAPHPSPIDSGHRRRAGESGHDRHMSRPSVVRHDSGNEATGLRPPKRFTAPKSVGNGNSDETYARSQPGSRVESQPSSGWPTNPPHWSDDGKSVAAGTVLKDRFVLEEMIGRGGMGTVFRARDRRKEEAQDRFPYVAVKILNDDFRRHPDSLKALQREARKAQALAHGNIVAVYDFDRDGPLVFLVMELLEGISLERLIKDGSRRGVSKTEALRILRGLGAALAHAHEKGVVHCDFKPANGFRCSDGAIKVVDFGIARVVGRRPMGADDTTRFDAGTLGALTPGYASCEMELGEKPDPRDDIFALACVAYELFSGRHPYDHQSAVHAERSGMKPEPIEGLDRRTWRGLQRGLAFARKDRTPTVEMFIAELSPKRRVGVAIAAVAASAGVAAIGAGLWFYPPGQSTPLVSPNDPLLASASEDARTPNSVPAAIPTAQNTGRPAVAGREKASSTGSQPLERRAPEVAGSAPEIPAPVAAPRKSEEALQAASAEVLKRQLVANAQANKVFDALDALQQLQARLPASDPFLVEEAPLQIGRAYQRLGAQMFASGNFDAAASMFDRAQERLPDDPALLVSQEQVTRVRAVAQMLESEEKISADVLQDRLREIRDAGDPEIFSTIRDRLADIFATRIRKELEAQPDVASENLSIARAVFAGVPSIDSIKGGQLAAQ